MSDSEFIVVNRRDLNVVVTPAEQVVVSRATDYNVITHTSETVVSAETLQTHVVTVAPPGAGTGGGGGAVFVTDVQPTASGIVSAKAYDTAKLVSCITDTTALRVFVGCEGGVDKYMPEVTVAGIPASLTESATKRWFTGYADITVLSGATTTITINSDAGDSDTFAVEALGAGPAITSITFGAYPGTQTELKQNDTITITVNTDVGATSVTVLAQGATTGTTLPVSAGTATGSITIAGTSGAQTVTAKAQNSFGTFGATFTSPTLNLNQTAPSIGGFTVAYPGAQSALGLADTGTVTSAVSNYNSITYSSSDLVIDTPTAYAAAKTITNSRTGYVNSGTNYTVTALRTANGATSSASTLVKIATVAPSAAISIVPSGRLTSSPAGINYDVRITPTQLLISAPSLDASVGTWSGSWVLSGAYWHRTLTVTDATARGVGSFSGLSLVGLSGIAGSTINSGAAFTVGGFSSRTVTFPAFSRVAALGVSVADATKLTFAVGATTYTRYTDNAVHTQGFYPANVDGSYNATGSYIGLSDSAFAGSNTTGTLQGTAQELA